MIVSDGNDTAIPTCASSCSVTHEPLSNVSLEVNLQVPPAQRAGNFLEFWEV